MRPDARAFELYTGLLDKRGRPIVVAPYFGSKVRLSRHLLRLLIPLPHYVEPFGGAFAVGLNRPRMVGREVYSDLNAPMVALMADMRDDYEATLWRLRYTPYSRREYGFAKDRLRADAAARETDAADESTVQRQSLMGVGAKGEWARTREIETKPTSRAVTEAGREGVVSRPEDVHVAHAHGHMGLPGGFGTHTGKTHSQTPSKAEAARVGIGADAYLMGDAAINSISADGHVGFAVNRKEHPRRSIIAANRLGVGADAATVHTSAMSGGESFGVSVDGEIIDTPKVVSASTRLGVDSFTTVHGSHLSMGEGAGFSKDGVANPGTRASAAARKVGVDAWESRSHGHAGLDGGFGTGKSAVKKDGDSAAEHPHIAANQLGVSADAATVQQMSWDGRNSATLPNFTQTPASSPRNGGSAARSIPVTERLGIDAKIAAAQSHLHFGGSWGASRDATARPSSKARTEAERVGVVAPPGWDRTPAGYVVAASGVDAIATLVSYPPTKCETLNDESGEVVDLFAAARERPVDLWRAGVDAVKTVGDAVNLARKIKLIAAPAVAAKDDLIGAWRAIAKTWYGALLWRLKRVQIEDKTEEAVRTGYEHPTSAQLVAPSGEGEWLGYAKPLSETPLTRVHERLQGVEIRLADALDVIGEWADNPDALIYADPPYLHATRKGTRDYDHEMTDDQHAAMLALLTGARASVLISGYPNALYADALAGWHMTSWEVNASSAVGKNGPGKESGRSRRIETAWWNYDLDEWRPRQMALV